MKKTMPYIILALYAVVLVLAGTGCRNTAQGMGQDIERAGEEIQEKTQ